jgi:hypothetical protein
VSKRPLSDYIALALLTEKKVDQDWMSGLTERKDFTGDNEELQRFAEERCGFRIGHDVLKAALRTLGDCDLVSISNDRFSGDFVRIRKTQLSAFISQSQSEMKQFLDDDGVMADLEKYKSDYRKAFAVVDHVLIAEYIDFGEDWLDRALLGLRSYVGDQELSLEMDEAIGLDQAPASDRIVTLTDNQAEVLKGKTAELIEAFQKENAVDGEVGLRARIIGQLKAGNELLMSGIFSVQAMIFTMVSALNFLAKRYEKEIIGALASALLVELAKIL